jgi:hypothetical protein
LRPLNTWEEEIAFTHFISSPLCQITRMLPMLHSSGESLARRSLEQSTLYQQTALGQTTMRDPRAAAAALLSQQSLNRFGGGSSSMPPRRFLGLQGSNTVPGGSGARLDLSAAMLVDRNRAAINQTYLRLLQDKATAAAVASRLRNTGQKGILGGMPRQTDEPGRGLPDGRRY